MGNQIFKLLLDDYSLPGFVSFDKEYYGTLEQIKTFISELKFHPKTSTHQKNLIHAFEMYEAGNKKLTHQVAFREVPFLVPAKLLGKKTSTKENYEWEHLNVWHWPYMMKCDKATSTHIWLSCRGRYIRCIQTHFENIQYDESPNVYKQLGGMILGYPGQIVGRRGFLYNRLFVEEKVFKTKSEAIMDYENFEKNKDINFKEILNDVFGDG